MQNVSLEAGKYIVAVSGGIDSVVLLDVLLQLPGVELVVAHVDHGIRSDSDQDVVMVQGLAEQYHLSFETTRFELGPNAPESLAREKRYAWLELVQAKYGADAIVTAHHQDDVIETIFINIMRGTGWRGLASLREIDQRRRPFLNISKIDIVNYAIEHDLQWHEDSTNDDLRYLRNYIRHGIMPRLSLAARTKLVDLYHDQCRLRTQIETEVAQLPSAGDDQGMSRYWLIMTPDDAAREVLHQKYGSLTRSQSARLLHFARCARPGAILELSAGQTFQVSVIQLIFLGR